MVGRACKYRPDTGGDDAGDLILQGVAGNVATAADGSELTVAKLSQP